MFLEFFGHVSFFNQPLGLGTFYDRYDSVLSACALDIDVARMIGRDLCVIGDNGFNLSGGQKTRLALAR
jgi:ABC-type transport system involved in cytochrome bd biosynthesis fused ATPase/permease subunit